MIKTGTTTDMRDNQTARTRKIMKARVEAGSQGSRYLQQT